MELRTQTLPAIIDLFYSKIPDFQMVTPICFTATILSQGGWLVDMTDINGRKHETLIGNRELAGHTEVFGMGKVDKNMYQFRYNGRTLLARVTPSWFTDEDRCGGPVVLPDDWHVFAVYNEAGDVVTHALYEPNKAEIDAILERIIDLTELEED